MTTSEVAETLEAVENIGASYSSIFLLLILLFLPLAILFIFSIYQYKNAAKRKMVYAVIVTGDKRSIYEIASICKLDIVTTEKIIQRAISAANTNDLTVKMLRNAYIDYKQKSIILEMDNQNYETVETKPSILETALNAFGFIGIEKSLRHKQKRVVKCKSCGGNTIIIEGKSSECDYCGSPLS